MSRQSCPSSTLDRRTVSRLAYEDRSPRQRTHAGVGDRHPARLEPFRSHREDDLHALQIEHHELCVALSLFILVAFWPWTRQPRILLSIAVSAVMGIVLWNTLLNLTSAHALNVDSPFLGPSVQDVGSGVCAFVVALLRAAIPHQQRRTSQPKPGGFRDCRSGDDHR